MINLIPPSAQTEVRKEYWLRVATVWLFLCGSALLILVVLNIPLHVLVGSQLDAFSNEYAQANLESELFKGSEEAVKKANDVAQLLSNTHDEPTFSKIIEEIESLSGSDIRILDVTLTRKGALLEPIVVRGSAASRLALTEFQDALEAHPLFKQAELPLSNLARDKDIVFTITIEPESKKQ
jgi:hypothetical protein